MCCTYPDQPPTLSVDDRHVSVTVTVSDSGRVTPEDVETARRLADAVAVYLAELETRMTAQDPAAAPSAA
jgi:soluble P-type ATPase